jgi:4-amino-4-deoxy-L-arabinose transferase-like glycosyltransferase
MQRSWRTILWFLHWPGILIAAFITLAWPAAILFQYPDAGELWWTHTFGRMGGANVINPGPIWYYFVNLPWQIVPWTLMVFLAWPQSLRQAWRERNPVERFQWLWLLLPLLALSAIKAKHHHYLIHALPPCAIWAARGLILFRDWLASRLPSLIGSHRSAVAAGSLFVLLWGTYAIVHTQFIGRSDGYREETAFLQRVNELRHDDRPLFIYRLEPSRLLLYSKEPIEVFLSPAAMRKRAQECGNVLVLTSVGQESELLWAGEPTCVERMPHSRRKHLGPLAQLALYQMNWKEPDDRRGRNSRSVSRTMADE